MNTKTPATGLNDDDLYLIDVQKGKVIRRIGARRDYPGAYNTFTVPLGHAAMYGMQAKWFVKEAA